MRYIALILVLVFASCKHDSEDSFANPMNEGGVLNIYIYPADDPMVTRADEGLVNSYAQEKAVKSLKIWVFKHANSMDDDLPLHYLSPDDIELQGSRAKLFQIALTAEQVEALTGDASQVDVYVLANAESIGQNGLNETSTRKEVRDALISTSYFSTTSPTTDISTNGLPISGCGENISVKGTLPVLSLPVVKLTRCVSKLRFILAQNKDIDSEFSISSIQLDGYLFPATENVFNTSNLPYCISDVYVPGTINFTPPTEIAKSERVSDLVYKSQQAQDYEDIVDGYVERGEATQMGPYYFRESDKCLRGTIGYRIKEKDSPEVSKTISFSMSDVPGNYHFSRNHTWIVYAYYLGGEELHLNLAFVTSWNEEDRERDIYNW